MKSVRKSKLLAVGLVALLALVAVTNGAAAESGHPPVHSDYEFSHVYVFGECYEGDDYFQILHDYASYSRRTTFFDQDGNAVREQFHETGEDLFINSVTGHSLAGHTSHVTLFWDLVDGSVGASGVGFHIVIPGSGTILIDAGMYFDPDRFDPDGDPPFWRGNHQVIDGHLDELCAALAGP